jgi:uncharacterized protein DUF2442
MIRVKSVQALDSCRVRLVFTDGSEKAMDLAPFLHGPVFDDLKKDPARFREVTVDPELGTIVWPNGADICPDVLYYGRIPASQEKAVR